MLSHFLTACAKLHPTFGHPEISVHTFLMQINLASLQLEMFCFPLLIIGKCLLYFCLQTGDISVVVCIFQYNFLEQFTDV